MQWKELRTERWGEKERALSEEPGAQANAEAVTSYEGPLRADATGQAGPGAVPGRH